ncbi:hypothetical protein GOP47_0000925 [Adiantum capillus-veneris]|uniref:Homing endonuclease LAGLIDADG domain-containing protein n=1 Tax=Adiantum capillus-veneris TaxID=13818 RepID=A0A9D4VFN1_ADICA|nr:hypothetical protein GOP47_0000925 [Adiantum capillus-veneris]
MIKARGGLLSHAHSAGGALLQRQDSPRSLPHSAPHSSLKILLASRVFRGFFPICDGENHDSACRSLHGCSRNGSKHSSILALWSFESKSRHFEHATRLTTKGLHTSTRKKLTTSELIKSLQLAKRGGSKAPTSNKALVTDDCSVEGGKVHEIMRQGLNSSLSSDNLEEDRQPDVGTIKKPLSMLIPQHVVDMGFAKKESFSKNQDQQRGSTEVFQGTEHRVSNQKHRIPVLHLESVRNDVADEYSGPNAEIGANQGNQQTLSAQQLAPQISERASRGKKAVTIGSVKHWDLVGVAFDTDPTARKASASNLAVRQVRKHGEHVDVSNEKQSVTRDSEGLRKQTEGFCEGAALAREGCQPVGKPSFESKTQGEMHDGSEQGKPIERISERIQTWPSATSPNSSEIQPPLHQLSSNSVEKSSDIAGKQINIQLSSSTPFQKMSEGISQHDKGVGLHRASKAFDRWLSKDPLPEESTPAAAEKPFDRNRPRKRKKNELKEKDLSVKPNAGEPHYEYLIRRKQVRAEAQKALVDDVDDYEHVGDDWMRKRLGWLCKEIPVLKASGIVKMLNNQRKWIKQEHVKELIEHLVRYMELNRAHRVLKWMQQQPLYEFEYELHNNMAFILGRNNKLSRCQDVFDEIVRNGKFPDTAVFTALIKAYLDKGDKGDINDAWKLYNQMLQLGLTVSDSLSETLLKSLTCPTGRWIRQSEELFQKMKASGMYINEDMYNRVMDIYGKRGDHKKIDAMMNELTSNHLKLTVGILNAKLEACVSDGDTVRAEGTLREMVEMGLKPDWRSFANLIQVYGKANMPMQSWETFEKMKGISIPINFVTYHAIIEAMAADGQHEERVMQVLTEVEESGIKPLQPCYNTVMNMYLRLKKYDEVESIFNRGKAAKSRPAHAAYNMLMKAYTATGQLDKAEALFQKMKVTEGMGPNTHTYNILLEGYGIACFKARVRELFEEMSAKGCQLDPDVREKILGMISVKKITELEKKKLILTDEQREIIPGLLLGGAKMESPDRNRTFELHLEFNCEHVVKRAIKDRLSFLFQAWWKPSQSVVLTASDECEEAHMEGSATESFIRLETVNHGSFRFYAHQYRPNGEPIIPKLIHRWLKPRTLAYWYMYGGRKCQRTGGIILNASKYSGKQIQLVVKALKARTMDCRRKKRRNGDVIRFEGRSAMWLWKLMEPHILKNVKEQLKPEAIPVDLALAKGTKSWDAQDYNVDEASSDEGDWDELEADKREEPMQILED